MRVTHWYVHLFCKQFVTCFLPGHWKEAAASKIYNQRVQVLPSGKICEPHLCLACFLLPNIVFVLFLQVQHAGAALLH